MFVSTYSWVYGAAKASSDGEIELLNAPLLAWYAVALPAWPPPQVLVEAVLRRRSRRRSWRRGTCRRSRWRSRRPAASRPPWSSPAGSTMSSSSRPCGGADEQRVVAAAVEVVDRVDVVVGPRRCQAGEQRRPGGRAVEAGVGIVEGLALLGQPVDRRRLVEVVAVAEVGAAGAEVGPAEVVGHHVDDVGPRRRVGRVAGRGGGAQRLGGGDRRQAGERAEEGEHGGRRQGAEHAAGLQGGHGYLSRGCPALDPLAAGQRPLTPPTIGTICYMSSPAARRPRPPAGDPVGASSRGLSPVAPAEPAAPSAAAGPRPPRSTGAKWRSPAARSRWATRSARATRQDGEGPVAPRAPLALPHRRDDGDQRAVRDLRQGDRPRHRGRAGRLLLRLPRSRSRLTPADVLGAADGTPWWLTVRGASWRHPAGPRSELRRPAAPPGRARDAGSTRRRTAAGPASGCPPRRSGSTPRAAGSTARASPGATSCWLERPLALQHLAGRLPARNTARRRLPHHRAGEVVPAQRLRALPVRRQRLGVVPGRLRSPD